MSIDQEDMPKPTRPQKEHEWLQKLVGEWKVTTEMLMPDGTTVKGTGRESVKSLNGLWAQTNGESAMPDGEVMHYVAGIGYDVSFNKYIGFWIADMSSHLWKYDCELSADGKVLTMNCVGPNMMGGDSLTANYRDIIELVDANTYTRTTTGDDGKGGWIPFVVSTMTRV